MHKTRTRRQQIATRSFTYGFMTLLAVFGVLFCLAYAMGFRFNFDDGKLTQVALIQFNSFPTGATVKIDGQTLPSKTQTRSNVSAGQHTVTISKDGYRSWQKTVNLKPSQVLWLDYIRLVPNSITTDSIKNFSDIQQMVESPDAHWLLIQERKQTVSKLTLADISDPKNVRFSEISLDPEKIMTANAEQNEEFSIVEWDKGSRYALIQHEVDGATEFLQIDRQNAKTTKNLTRDFGLEIRNPHFSGKSGLVFFGLTGNDLRKFDYSNNTASAPLVTGVESYQIHSESSRIAFVTSETKDGKQIQTVGIYDDGRTKTVKTYDQIEKTIVGLTRWRDADYLAVARGETLAIYPEPLKEDNGLKPFYLSSPGGIDWLNFSPKGRHVMAGRQSKVVNFDLDTSENYSFELDGLADAPEWLDETHILSKLGGRLSFVEFDGSNREDIVSANGAAALSYDEKYLFSFGDSASGASLQRSRLYVD